MCGTTSETTSPSVRRTRRRTPCVLGCCGPMLTSISSVRTSNSTIVWSLAAVDMVVPLGEEAFRVQLPGAVVEGIDQHLAAVIPVDGRVVAVQEFADVRTADFFHHPAAFREASEPLQRGPELAQEVCGLLWRVLGGVPPDVPEV